MLHHGCAVKGNRHVSTCSAWKYSDTHIVTVMGEIIHTSDENFTQLFQPYQSYQHLWILYCRKPFQWLYPGAFLPTLKVITLLIAYHKLPRCRISATITCFQSTARTVQNFQRLVDPKPRIYTVYVPIKTFLLLHVAFLVYNKNAIEHILKNMLESISTLTKSSSSLQTLFYVGPVATFQVLTKDVTAFAINYWKSDCKLFQQLSYD